MSGRPQDSLYFARQDSLYPRPRRPAPAPQAPNNVGVILLAMVVLAIIVALVLVAPGLLSEVRHVVYCLNHAQEAVCQR